MVKPAKLILHSFKDVPLIGRIIIGLTLGIGVACLVTFLIPKTIHFSYAGNSCVSQLLIAPHAEQQRGDSEFMLMPDGILSIGGVTILSTHVCAVAKMSPTGTSHQASLGLFGGWFVAKQFRIAVADAPKVVIDSIVNTKVSAVRLLKIPLSSGDSINTYSLVKGDQKGTCQYKDTTLSCNMEALKLAPNTDYDLQVQRTYAKETPQAIATVHVTTLNAVALVSSTLSDTQTIYDMPTAFGFTFDQPLENGEATLVTAQGAAVKATVTAAGSVVTVKTADALARNTAYTLSLNQVEAVNGASLAAPVVRHFTTSGGPSVTDTSIGSSNVGQNAAITVTFDQPIADSVDVTKVARVTGVAGVVTKKSPTEIVITLQSAPLCAAFSVVVDKGIKSGVNNEVSASDWKFDSRTVCGTSATIGYSVRGRAITAYYFGNGSTVLLYVGGIHGMEPAGATTMQAWVTYLMANAYKIPADKRVVVVPNINPDGIATNTRNNANNVNLDRNFPAANWSTSIDTDAGILPTGGGSAPLSEPESATLATLTRQLRPRLEVSFHAQGRLVGANENGDSVSIGNTYANMVGYATMFGNAEAEMGHSITGEYEDWMGQEMNIPAILIELPTLSGNYFSSQQAALLKTLSV